MGFKLHTIIPDKLYQRGNLNHISYSELKYNIQHYGIDIVFGLAGGYNSHIAGLMHENITSYVYYPIADNKLKPDEIEFLMDYAISIADALRGPHAALVHCNAGRNRSGLLNALIVREYYDCSGEDALHLVQVCRPNALANDHFVAFLKSLS